MDTIQNLWNYNYAQMQAQRHHQSQIFQVNDTARKLQEFLDSADKVEPAYQGELLAECSEVLVAYAKKHKII